jgi:hypothetical protein
MQHNTALHIFNSSVQWHTQMYVRITLKQVAVSLGLTGRTNARVARCSTHSTKAAAAAAAASKAAETATTNSSSSSTPTLPKIANSSSSSSDVLEDSHNSNNSAAASIDPRLESSVEWLLKHVTENYTHLQRRVAADVADMEAQFEAQKVSLLYFKFLLSRSIGSHCCDHSRTQHQL